MNKIASVKITKFWGDKTVSINFNQDVNFLIGVNGSGKTTVINLIAATLSADFRTLDRIQFETIEILLYPKLNSKNHLEEGVIRVEKIGRDNSPFPQIVFSLKSFNNSKFKKFALDDLEEDYYYRYHNEIILGNKKLKRSYTNDLSIELKKLINVSWLTIHRMSHNKRREDKGFESTIDLKIEELQIDLVKYFSQLNRKYATETEKFQKFIFESLIDSSQYDNILQGVNINTEKEKESLRSIFDYFAISKESFNKLDNYFNEFNYAASKFNNKNDLNIQDFSFLLGVIRIHSIVEEWNNIIAKQKSINKTKEVFLHTINNLLQRKRIFINEKNELMVETQSEKVFSLTHLSSGEKQLLIIFGQSLLQEESTHIYIADEPELSLHIEWQEQLVKNLKNINPNSQIIFATHSPDIVGEYEEYIIKIENSIK